MKPEGKVAIIMVESCDFWSLHNLKKDAAIRASFSHAFPTPMTSMLTGQGTMGNPDKVRSSWTTHSMKIDSATTTSLYCKTVGAESAQCWQHSN